MESTDTVELQKRDEFFKQDIVEIRETLLRALCELSEGRIEPIWIEDIDEHIHGGRHPNAEQMKEATKPADERYRSHFLYLHEKGYLVISSIKIYPKPKVFDWCRTGGPI
jgi:hypothetical protein